MPVTDFTDDRERLVDMLRRAGFIERVAQPLSAPTQGEFMLDRGSLLVGGGSLVTLISFNPDGSIAAWGAFE